MMVGFTLILLTATPANADAPLESTKEYCLSCHNNPELSMVLPNGETLSLYISPQMLEHSVHSLSGIECQACHTEITTYPHPEIEYNSKRELSRAYYLACQKCHSANYDKTMDSIHAEVAEQGNLDAPVCTDCHGAHDVRPAGQPRTLISTTCGKCHSEILDVYKDSVHGHALIEEDNADVPVCTSCHGVHNIQDPRTNQFRIDTPDLCAGCHADAELMGKYGLSADVYDLYQLSWHGVDVSVYKARWPTIWHDSAVCTDCHGVHNILSENDPKSMVHPDNLLITCQECHAQAGPNWTSAWTGHNQIRQERTPLLFYVDAFYSSFAPVVLWASAIYVVLQIVHAIVNRIRRSLP
jgi:predicted CXXCH cytochrome family protein